MCTTQGWRELADLHNLAKNCDDAADFHKSIQITFKQLALSGRKFTDVSRSHSAKRLKILLAKISRIRESKKRNEPVPDSRKKSQFKSRYFSSQTRHQSNAKHSRDKIPLISRVNLATQQQIDSRSLSNRSVITSFQSITNNSTSAPCFSVPPPNFVPLSVTPSIHSHFSAPVFTSSMFTPPPLANHIFPTPTCFCAMVPYPHVHRI